MPSVETQIKNILTLPDEAIKHGCTRAKLVWAKDIIYDPRVNLKCRQNLCSHYGKNFMCPPFVPSGEEFKMSSDRFKITMLIQKEEVLDPAMLPEEKNRKFKKVSLHILNVLLTLEKTAFNLGFHFSMGLSGGNCKLCEICGAKMGAEYCSKPNMARPSMEAVGIDVMSTCARAGLPVDFIGEKVYAVGLLYID